MAIHASKNSPKWARELCFKEPFKQALVDTGYSGPEKLPRGAVVGITNMYDCQPITKENTPGEPERSFGDYSEGRYALYWKGTKALTDPVPAKGALGLWEWAPGENFPMKRICPDCGDEILTSDNTSILICQYCGTKILPPGSGVCRVCGCTDQYGCLEGCYWVEPDLCSSCAGN